MSLNNLLKILECSIRESSLAPDVLFFALSLHISLFVTTVYRGSFRCSRISFHRRCRSRYGNIISFTIRILCILLSRCYSLSPSGSQLVTSLDQTLSLFLRKFLSLLSFQVVFWGIYWDLLLDFQAGSFYYRSIKLSRNKFCYCLSFLTSSCHSFS